MRLISETTCQKTAEIEMTLLLKTKTYLKEVSN